MPKHGKIYIYGAGIAAYYLAKSILAAGGGHKLSGFLVQSRQGNPYHYFGIPVRELSETFNVMDDAYVFIGLYIDKQDGVEDALRAKGFSHIYALTREDYLSLRFSAADAEGEIYQGVRELLGRTNPLIGMLENTGQYFSMGIEEKMYGEAFGRMVRDGTLSEYVDALTSGLPKEECIEVYRIVSRLFAMREHRPIQYDKEERECVKAVQNSFACKIYKLSENRFYSAYADVFLPRNHFEASVFYYDCGLTALRYPQHINGRTVLDVGGFIGDSACMFRRKYNVGRIYSFEATEKYCNLIRQTIQMNEMTDIYPVHLALSDRDGEGNLYESKSDSTNSMVWTPAFFDESAHITRIPCQKLDTWVEKNGTSDIGFIKVDIEGAEQAFLRGAIKTLRTQHPTLAISIYHSLDDFFAIKTWLERNVPEYELHIFRPVLGFNFMLETMLIAELPE